MRRACLALVTALVLPLTACGSSSVDGYCAQLQTDRTKIADMITADTPSALLGNLPLLHDLADQAPEDVADEWQTFLGALDALDKALGRADVKASDFKDGKPPATLSAADRASIAGAVQQVSSDDVVTAANGIEQQARDVCKVNLGL